MSKITKIFTSQQVYSFQVMAIDVWNAYRDLGVTNTLLDGALRIAQLDQGLRKDILETKDKVRRIKSEYEKNRNISRAITIICIIIGIMFANNDHLFWALISIFIAPYVIKGFLFQSNQPSKE